MWQKRYLVQNRAFNGLVSSDTIPLPTSGKLAALVITPRWTNLAAGANTLSIHDLFTDIRVTRNGSDVIYALDGLAALGVAYHRGYGVMYGNRDHALSQIQSGRIVVPFGLGPYDADYGLNLKNCPNPQLTLTWSNAGVSGDALGGWAATVGSFDVQMILADDSLPYREFISHRIIDNFVVTASVMRPTSIVTRNLTSALYLKLNNSTTTPWAEVAQVTVNIGNGANRPFDATLQDILFEQPSIYGEAEEYHRLSGPVIAGALTYALPFMAVQSVSAIPTGALANEYFIADTPNVPNQAFTTAVASVKNPCIVRGLGYGKLVAMDFAAAESNGGLPPSGDDRVTLEVTGATTAGGAVTASVILEEVMA